MIYAVFFAYQGNHDRQKKWINQRGYGQAPKCDSRETGEGVRKEANYLCSAVPNPTILKHPFGILQGTMSSPVGHFSVVIPARNAQATITNTLNSAISQQYQPDEIIVVDDGSSDQTALIVENGFPDVRLVRNSIPGGPGYARNVGAAHARNRWIAFLDADDLWGTNHLGTLADGVNHHPAAGIVATHYFQGSRSAAVAKLSGPRPRQERIRWRKINYALSATLRPGLVWSSAIAVNRDALSQVGGFSGAPTGQDTECWLAISFEYDVIKTHTETAAYVTSSQGISFKRMQNRKSRELVPYDSIELAQLGPSSVLADKRLREVRGTKSTSLTNSLRLFLMSRVLWNALADLKFHSRAQCVETLAFGIEFLGPRDRPRRRATLLAFAVPISLIMEVALTVRRMQGSLCNWKRRRDHATSL